MDFILHVGAPAVLGLIGGGIFGASHYYATKPMSIKEPDPETGIRNTTLLSYHPAVMGSLHDLVTYRAASVSAVKKIRNALEEIEAINIYSVTAPLHKLRLDMITASRKLGDFVNEVLQEQYLLHGYATTEPRGQLVEPFLQGVHRAIVDFVENSSRNLEVTMRQRLNVEAIGEVFVRDVEALEKSLMQSHKAPS